MAWGTTEGTDPVHDTDINAQNWACNQWVDIRAASGAASASGDDPPAKTLQDDFDSAEEPPVDAQWISSDVAPPSATEGLDVFFAEPLTHGNAEEPNCKHARIFKQVVSTFCLTLIQSRLQPTNPWQLVAPLMQAPQRWQLVKLLRRHHAVLIWRTHGRDFTRGS